MSNLVNKNIIQNNLIEVKSGNVLIAQAREQLIIKYLDRCYSGARSSGIKKKMKFIQEYNSGKWPYIFQQLQEVSYQTLERWKKKYLDAGEVLAALMPGKSNVEKILNEMLIQIHLETDKTLLPDIQKEAIQMIKAGRAKIYFLNTN